MIVPMQKVIVLSRAAGREADLLSLRQLGVLHPVLEQAVEHEDIEGERRRLDYIRRAAEVLPNLPRAQPSGRSPGEVVDELSRLLRLRRETAEELERLRQECARVSPFGDFSPGDLAALAGKGVFIRLFQAAPDSRPVVPAAAVCLETSRTRTAVSFVIVTVGETPEIAAQELRPPAMSLAEIKSRIGEMEATQARIADQIGCFAGDRAALADMRAEAEEAVQMAEIRAGMSCAAAELVYLQGFCPSDDVPRLREAAGKNGWGLVIDEPAASDLVPTLIRNPRWLKPIESVFELIGILPGYREIDVSLWFLLFFSLFFAMLVGDAGYGAIFLGLTLWAQRRFPTSPTHAFTLLKITSVATIVWGVLTGTYFGIPDLPAPLAALKLSWLGDEEHVKDLCFWIAAIHLSIAHVWNIANLIRSPQALAQVGWLCVVWFMFFSARSVVLNLPFPSIMTWVFGAGVVLIVLFMTPRRNLRDEWFNHVMLPLNLVGSFVDVISYIRLYAVGTASFAIASTFNIMLAPMFDGWLSGLLAALLLFVAHTVNIVLSVMGVMVHGIRLNTLEFASHLGLQWSGFPYRPWQRMRPTSP
ncbi:MAG: hypothetical protein FAZ92_01061 [Accumulibacter sp.]|uniref:V-type ATP synthase subunit I n=1 Tax=Accumulibacter sp. TaxID=2053492 RepID=UPI0011F7C886|nr:hypothetical protein [Accumulibacter sp.]QKS27696.1 MAG: hypothetical protein HT579_01160 [Candidatus Accumulibacter similis]TLD46654.1 MAG: hypothetical protein FAZ92_01061 [Accumulibacter sp.]